MPICKDKSLVRLQVYMSGSHLWENSQKTKSMQNPCFYSDTIKDTKGLKYSAELLKRNILFKNSNIRGKYDNAYLINNQTNQLMEYYHKGIAVSPESEAFKLASKRFNN